jgi:hypothetical protein
MAVISHWVTLTVLSAPAIIQHPRDVSVWMGQNATFIVGATGSPAVQFQWQYRNNLLDNWRDVPGATSQILMVPNASILINGRQYRARVTNSQGVAYSASATLTVRLPPNRRDIMIYYDSSAAAQFTPAQMIAMVAEAVTIFSTEFGINFTILGTMERAELDGGFVGTGGDCPFPNNSPCRNACGSSFMDCIPRHHKSATRLLHKVPSTSSSVFVVRLVGHVFCIPVLNDQGEYVCRANEVQGAAWMPHSHSPSQLDSIVSLLGEMVIAVIRHEIAHNLGASSTAGAAHGYHCTHINTQDCVMKAPRDNYFCANSFCDDCRNDIFNNR